MPAASPKKTKSAPKYVQGWFDGGKQLIAGFIFTVLVVIAAGLAAGGKQQIAVVGGTPVQVEIADTRPARAQGLSARESLTKGSGMLFVYEEPQRPGFWMRDMRFAIDIIWIGADRRVVDITPNLTPDTYPQVFRPNQPIQYVLEINTGFAKEYGIKLGDEVELPLKSAIAYTGDYEY